MTTTIHTDEDADFSGDRNSTETFGDYVVGYITRVRGGDTGSLPAITGLIILFVIFTLANDKFLTANNLANLIVQAAAICVLAMGVTFVLLLGDIDLSAGVNGATSASVTALLIVRHEQPWWLALLAGLATGIVIGAVIGAIVSKVGVPSFVVTLAFFLGLQGVILKMIGQGGSVRISDNPLRDLTIKNVPVTWGWILCVIAVAALALLTLRRHHKRVRQGLVHEPMSVVVTKITASGLILVGLTWLLSINRAPTKFIVLQGIPWVLLVVAALLLLWTFVLDRTAYGRHLYAVGGNSEAARRAGINVNRMRISAFMITGGMAAVAGILSASFTGSVSPSSGGGNTLLYAVGAAVIGGTSLFGGRGRAINAVIGGVVIATIANGLGLLNQAAWINFVVTGTVLLLAASVDAMSRRRRSASGV